MGESPSPVMRVSCEWGNQSRSHVFMFFSMESLLQLIKNRMKIKNTTAFKSIEIIKTLAKLGTRQGAVARRACTFIDTLLKKNKIPFLVETFDTYIPVVQEARLVIDGKKQPCVGCGMTSGDIPTTHIASSLMSSRFLIDTPTIYFNPKCPVPSPTNFSFAPAIAIAPGILEKLVYARQAKASLRVRKQKTEASFLLVGNRVNPKTIIFSHYDSLGPGAIDNASGTAVALSVATRCSKENILDETLFVFDGNEEISYDYPVYWGHGYRVFEERYQALLKNAKAVLVVDCVGNGRNYFIQDETILKLAFPLKNVEQIKHKTWLLSGDIEDLMTVYHSEKDTTKKVSLRQLRQAEDILFERIQANAHFA